MRELGCASFAVCEELVVAGARVGAGGTLGAAASLAGGVSRGGVCCWSLDLELVPLLLALLLGAVFVASSHIGARLCAFTMALHGGSEVL